MGSKGGRKPTGGKDKVGNPRWQEEEEIGKIHNIA